MIYQSSTKTSFSLICGVSAGAIVGALVATDRIQSMCIDRVKDTIVNLFATNDKSTQFGTILKGSIYTGKSKRMALEELFGDTLLGDVSTPLMILANSETDGPTLFSSLNPDHVDLSLASLLDATTAAPIVFPPVEINGIEYTDGATVSNNPLSVTYLSCILHGWDFEQLGCLSIGIDDERVKPEVPSHIRQTGILGLLRPRCIWHHITSCSSMSNHIVTNILRKSNALLRISIEYESRIDDTKILDNMIKEAIESYHTHYMDIQSMFPDDTESEVKTPGLTE